MTVSIVQNEVLSLPATKCLQQKLTSRKKMVHYPTSFWCQEKASLSSEKAECCAKFNTVHHIAKEERTFTLFISEVLLQK